MLHKDTWLSSYFTSGAYRLDVDTYGETSKNSLQGFTFTKLGPSKLDTLKHLLSDGFELIETQLTWHQNKTIPYMPSKDLDLRFAKPPDAAAVKNIGSQVFVCSRFQQDKNIPRETANKIKEDWVGNYFSGKRGDQMIVAVAQNCVVGFLLLVNKNIIDLIGVDTGFTNRGIALSMIAFANQHVGLLQAGTQLINQASIGLYQKANFSLKSSQYILHHHE